MFPLCCISILVLTCAGYSATVTPHARSSMNPKSVFPTQFGAMREVGAQHQKRARLMMIVGSLASLAISAHWAFFFFVRGIEGIAAYNLGASVASALALWLTMHGKTRVGAWLMISVMSASIGFSSIALDIPTSELPRTAHMFFLPLAVASMLLLRHERAWIRQAVPLFCVTAFFVFSTTGDLWQSPFALPREIRLVGTPVNALAAFLCLCLLLYVMQRDMVERNELEIELQGALVRGEMQLYYQPQFDDNMNILGAEALLRWTHHKRGAISPAEFIPMAERSGFIIALGEWVLRQAAAQVVKWSADDALRDQVVAVNISAEQIRQPGFAEQVIDIVSGIGARPDRLKLELTESALVADHADVEIKMGALKSWGIGWSLDDFGTGFSSLVYLRKLPLDQIKIDQTFVRDLLSDSNARAIVRSVIELGRSLKLHVIAEGVETHAHRDFLFEHGCEAYQGYLLSPPLPVKEFEELVARRVATGFAPTHARI